jgi:RND family efflux transporter MFP subunit
MSHRIAGCAVLVSAMVIAVLAGCKKAQQGPPTPAPPVVPVSHPVQRIVNDYVEYTGLIDARQSVGIKARATGFLDSIGVGKDGKPIAEGAEVTKGDLLFQIDPRPYKFQLLQAKSQVTVVERQLNLAQITLNRDKEAFGKGGITSKQQIDQDEAAVAETQARLEAAKTSVKTYELNLEFASVAAPITGQISRFFFTPGNLIIQDQTLLTTLVDVEQVFAYFDMDERTLLRFNSLNGAGGNSKVLLSLDGETGFPHSGGLDFMNNVVNPATGTISVRGVYDNPKGANGKRLFVPGMFTHIRLPIGGPREGLLVVDRAIGSDQALKYVYVVKNNKAVYRRVFLGPLQDDGLRVIEPHKPATPTEVESGLLPDELVVVGSLPQIRPDMEITPQEREMPIPGGPIPTSGGEPAPTSTPSPKKK